MNEFQVVFDDNTRPALDQLLNDHGWELFELPLPEWDENGDSLPLYGIRSRAR